MTESQIIKLIQSLPESDRAVYLSPDKNYLREGMEIELKEGLEEILNIVEFNLEENK